MEYRELISGSKMRIRSRAMHIVSFTEARNNLKRILDEVVEDADYTVINRRDAADTMGMSLNSFNSLMETMHLLKSPANLSHLEKSVTQYQQGKSAEHPLVDGKASPANEETGN